MLLRKSPDFGGGECADRVSVCVRASGAARELRLTTSTESVALPKKAGQRVLA